MFVNLTNYHLMKHHLSRPGVPTERKLLKPDTQWVNTKGVLSVYFGIGTQIIQLPPPTILQGTLNTSSRYLLNLTV